jgi:hypothetical protein
MTMDQYMIHYMDLILSTRNQEIAATNLNA